MSNDPFYHSAAWRRFRAALLAESTRCDTMGCDEPASHIDHVKPINRGGARLDRGNVSRRCHSCHSRKTARFDRDDRQASTMPVRAKGCDANGMPRDPLHRWRQQS